MPAPSSIGLGGEEWEDGWTEEVEEREDGQVLTVEEMEREDEWLENRDENDEEEGKGMEVCGKKETSPPLRDRPNADACKDGDDGFAAWVGLAPC